MKSSFNFLIIRSNFILKVLQKHKYLTREEISSMWAEDYRSDGNEIERRAFFRNIDFIADTFQIYIKNEKRNGEFFYYISNPEDINSCQLLNWSIAAITMGDTLLQVRDLHDRIVLEQFPSENGRLLPILHAMKASVRIVFTYQKYNNSEIREHTIEPYCIKQYRQRFYVIGKTANDFIVPFALDRMLSLEVTKKKFTVPLSFNADEYFATSYGVMVSGKPETVVLRAIRDETYYINDVPLHHSQQVKHRGKDFTDFSFFLSPTNDFIGYILSRGERLQVISPSWLADEVRQRHLSAASVSL